MVDDSSIMPSTELDNALDIWFKNTKFGWRHAMRAVLDSLSSSKYKRGEEFYVEYDGFTGKIIGHYETLEGRKGVVLQLNNAKVVHVYNEERIKPVII